MTVNVGAAAQADFNVSGQTRCLASGDFDARVDFDLGTWPARNGVWLSLMAAGTPYNVYRVSWQFDESEAYGTYLPPAGNTLPASGTTGSLRLRRWGDIYTGYYLSGRRWVPLVSGIGPDRGHRVDARRVQHLERRNLRRGAGHGLVRQLPR